MGGHLVLRRGRPRLPDRRPDPRRPDKLVDDRLAAPFTADANDVVYAWESSGAYDPTPGLPRITAPLLAINAADDERNPPITGLTEQAVARIPGARLLLLPANAESRGHGSGGLAKLYARELGRGWGVCRGQASNSGRIESGAGAPTESLQLSGRCPRKSPTGSFAW